MVDLESQAHPVGKIFEQVKEEASRASGRPPDQPQTRPELLAPTGKNSDCRAEECAEARAEKNRYGRGGANPKGCCPKDSGRRKPAARPLLGNQILSGAFFRLAVARVATATAEQAKKAGREEDKDEAVVIGLPEDEAPDHPETRHQNDDVIKRGEPTETARRQQGQSQKREEHGQRTEGQGRGGNKMLRRLVLAP